MERRAFVKGVFGLSVLAIGAGAGVFNAQSALNGAARGSLVFTAPEGVVGAAASGPALQSGIQLFEGAGEIAGFYGDTQLFSVDEMGAALISFADGTRDIESIAREAGALLGCEFALAEVAAFFVALGQAGYLQDAFYVNLVENPA